MATEITIKDTLGNIRFVTPINEGAKRVRKLMGEDHVSFSFSVDTLIEFHLGDYADIEGEGRFCLIDTPYPSLDADTGGYTYELQLDAQYRKWANKLFKYLPQKGGQECSWSLTATIAIHAEQVLNAVNALGEQSSDFLFNGVTKWECAIDASVDAVVAKAITFDNINILDGISAIAEEFECEWWVTDNVIYFGKCELGDTEVELSRHSNVTEISRSETDENVANRIYAFGSTENLPNTYRKDLIFDVTNSVASSNGVRISDASRPLSHEWFDSDLLVDAPGAHIDLNEDNWLGLVGDITTQNGLSQSEVPVVTKTQELSPLVAGKYQFGLSLFKPFWNVASDSPVTGLSAEVIIYGTYSNGQLFRFTDKRFYPLDPAMFSTHEDKTFEIPKTMKVDGIEENITVKEVFAVVLISLRFSSYGTTTYSISTSDKPLKLFLPDRVYGVRNITIEILNGNLKGETITNVVYNPDFALDKSEANVLVVQAPIEDLPIGTTFKITNIKESLVPNSYYSEYYYANDDEDNYEVINAVADGRLRMPLEKGDYIDAYRYDDNNELVWLGEDGYDTAHEMPLAEVIDDVVIFDDVKPDHTFEITKSWYIQEEKKDEDNEPYTVYRFFFYDEIFDEANQFKQSYILEGKDLKIRFSSGKLNGMEFDLGYKNEEGNPTRWEIIVNKDATLPSTLFMAEEGDTFTMSGLNVQIIKEQYIDDAETRLFDMAFEYVIESNIDASSYTCTMKSEIMSGYEEGIGVRPENALSLGLGQRVLLKESIFFKNGRSSRIIGYEYPLDYPFDNPQYTVGTKAAYSRFGDIEDKLDGLSLSIGSSKGGGLSSYTSATSLANYVIGTNDTTPATDANVYSALRSIAEFIGRKSSQIIDYVWTFLNGVRVGQYVANASGANINAKGEAEVEKLISRTVVDSETVNANISVLSPHVSTADFVNNGLLGTGGGFYQLNGLTYAEFDYLTARRGMTVFELLIQEYRSIGGAFIVSPANGEVVNVVRWTNEESGLSGYNLTIKDFASNPQFVVGDLVRCAKWDADNDAYIGYWVEVEAVNKETGVISIWETDLNGAVPQVGDKLVQMGNTTDTTRQGCIEISTVNSLPRIAVYDGITSPVIDAKKNIKCLQGALTGFVDPYTNEVLSGYGIWGDNAYLTGELRIKSTGKTISETVNESVDAIQLGGRNLLLGTNQGTANWVLSTSIGATSYTIRGEKYQSYKGVSFIRNSYDSVPTYEVLMFPLRSELIAKGKTYHLSFDFLVASNTSADFLVALATAGGGSHLFIPLKNISHNGAGEYSHFDLDITATANGDDGITRYVYIATKADYLGTWEKVNIVNLKLEEGTKSTVWTPAPEDTDNNINDVKAIAEQAQTTADSVTNDLANYKTEVSAQFDVTNGNFTSIQTQVTTLESRDNQNLLLDSAKVINDRAYLLGTYDLGAIKPPVEGEQVTLSFSGYLGTGHGLFRIYNSGYSHQITTLSIADYNHDAKRFEKTFNWVVAESDNTAIHIYQADADGNGIEDYSDTSIVASRIYNVKLERSAKATAWSPAPEDTETKLESKIEQTAEEINLSVREEIDGVQTSLIDTGININDKTITVTAENFLVQNNDEEKTAGVDANGNLSVSSIACRYSEDGGATTENIAEWNTKGDGVQRWYFPNGTLRAEIGWDDATESMIRMYDNTGNLLWKIGNPSEFQTYSEPIWQTIPLVGAYSSYEDCASAVQTTENLQGKTYYRKTNTGDEETNNVVYKTNLGSSPELIDDGWYTNPGVPFVSISGGIDDSTVESLKNYHRTLYHYVSGKVTETQKLQWTNI